MQSEPFHTSFLIKWFIIIIYKIVTCKCIYRWLSHSGPVIFISSQICIKSTPFTKLAEAEAMRFVSNHTTIPVPQVYYAFEHKRRGYIVMERLQGQSLWHGWTRRPQESKDKILRSLRSMMQQLHSLPPPSAGVANICGGPIYDPRLTGELGPFESIHEFHMKLSNGFGKRTDRSELPFDLQKLLTFYDRSWPHPTFTHGDLSSSNIVACGDAIVGIIDWENAGWMPPYWEYTSARNVNPQNAFWEKEVDHFLPSYPEELEMEVVRRKYFGDY